MKVNILPCSTFLFGNSHLLGKFGERIFGEAYQGALLVIDYGVLKPSSTREEDLVIHVYTESAYTKLDSHAFHTIGGTDQKKELFVGMNSHFYQLVILITSLSFKFFYLYNRGFEEIFETALRLWISSNLL